MKKYSVDVDIKVSVTLYDVEAESEEEAMKKAEKQVWDDIYYHIRKSHYVSHKAYSADEQDES